MEILLSTLIYVWQLEYLDDTNTNRVEIFTTASSCWNRANQVQRITNNCQRNVVVGN